VGNHRKKKGGARISPYPKPNAKNPQSIKPEEIPNLRQACKRWVITICSSVATAFFGWGISEMSNGNGVVPWLIAIVFIMIGILVIYDDAFRYYVSHHVIKTNWIRRLVYIAVLLVIIPISSWFIFNNVTTHNAYVKSMTPIFFANLVPGNDNAPDYVSNSLSDNTVALMLGDNLAIIGNQSSKSILSHDNVSCLTIERHQDKTISIYTGIYDSEDNNVVNVINNEFQVDPRYSFNPIQPDPHSLIVRDSKGIEVLRMRYINSKVIWISGRFKVENYSQVVLIDNNGLQFGDIRISGDHTIFDVTKNPDEVFRF
jgi:hypothetical protein